MTAPRLIEEGSTPLVYPSRLVRALNQRYLILFYPPAFFLCWRSSRGTAVHMILDHSPSESFPLSYLDDIPTLAASILSTLPLRL